MKYNRRITDGCFCKDLSAFPYKPKYGEAYVPFQTEMGVIYTPGKALRLGTIFDSLNKPYMINKKGVNK